jgi:hypothetical protein
MYPLLTRRGGCGGGGGGGGRVGGGGGVGGGGLDRAREHGSCWVERWCGDGWMVYGIG